MKRSHLARDIVEIIVLTLLVFLAIHFTIQNYQISGFSMQNTLQPDQYVLVNKIAYLFHAPERGDIIILQEPDQPETDLIKRVIGLPGDSIKLDGTNVWVNGTELNEPYITQKSNPSATTLTVPPDKYFVMGDNRPKSKDSRYFGFVPKNYIVGKVILVDWPLKQWQFINTYPSVYARIR